MTREEKNGMIIEGVEGRVERILEIPEVRKEGREVAISEGGIWSEGERSKEQRKNEGRNNTGRRNKGGGVQSQYFTSELPF